MNVKLGRLEKRGPDLEAWNVGAFFKFIMKSDGWHLPIIPASQEPNSGGSHEQKSSRPVPHNVARTPFGKQEVKAKD